MSNPREPDEVYTVKLPTSIDLDAWPVVTSRQVKYNFYIGQLKIASLVYVEVEDRYVLRCLSGDYTGKVFDEIPEALKFIGDKLCPKNYQN